MAFQFWRIWMPWEEKSIMEQREEFVVLAQKEGTNFRELCRRYEISPTTGYKWVGRYLVGGGNGLVDQSKRPMNSPWRSADEVEALVVEARKAHPKWGARKLKRRLEDQGHRLPSASTVHAILLRHGCIDDAASEASRKWKRFEHAAPNDLWQMDFKGHFAMSKDRCHPLTVLDDHSRYVVCLEALDGEGFEGTQTCLIKTFRRYGLPWRMTMDNGSPWGALGCYTRFELWLMRLGIRVSHSRPYHPQTQGKDERFHRTLKAEVLQDQTFRDLAHAQKAFDHWLPIYNQERPHDSLGMGTPITRYVPSQRAYPESMPTLDYNASDEVRKVQGKGEFSYQGKEYSLGQAFAREQIALRRTAQSDLLREVYFGSHRVATISLKNQSVLSEKTRIK